MATDWTQLYLQYSGKWVALAEDEQTVLGSGKTAAEAFAIAEKKGFHKPILTRVPKKLVSYVGGV